VFLAVSSDAASCSCADGAYSLTWQGFQYTGTHTICNSSWAITLTCTSNNWVLSISCDGGSSGNATDTSYDCDPFLLNFPAFQHPNPGSNSVCCDSNKFTSFNMTVTE
jgi:hypothetical protein